MAQQIRKHNLMSTTGSWFKNAARSTASISKDIIVDMVPASMDVVTGFKSAAYDVNKSLFGQDAESMKTFRATADTLKQALTRAKEQIRTGDFTDGGKNPFDDMGLDDDFDFSFDDDLNLGDGEEQIDAGSKAVQSTMIAASNLETNAINSQTAVMSNLIQASTQTNAKMSVANTRMVQQVGTQMAAGMKAINDNLSLLVKFQSQTMGTFVSTSMKYYDDSIQMMKMMSEMNRLSSSTTSGNKSFNNSILSSISGIDVNNYVSRVKKNISNKKDSNMGLSMLSFLADPMILSGIKNNPMDIISKAFINSIIPGAMKNSAKKLDKSIQNFLPSLLMKVSGWRDDYNNPMKRLMGEIFGIDTKYKNKVEYKKLENQSIAFDKETKNYISASLVYQRKILSAITGSPEMIYDPRTDTFKYGNKLKKEFNQERRKASIPMDMAMDINSMIQGISKVNKGVSYSDKKILKETLEDFFIEQSKSGKLPNISSRDSITRLLKNSKPDMSNEMAMLLTSMINGLPNQTKMRMFGSNLIGSREGNNAFMENIENAPGGYKFMFDGSEDYSRLINAKNAKGKRGYSTTSDSSLLFRDKTDRYGMSMFDYMHDIKYLLLKGIRVFPNYRHLNGKNLSGPDPTDHIAKMLREMNEDAYSTAPNQQDLDLFTSGSNSYNGPKKEGILDRMEREKFQNLFMESQYKELMQAEQDSDLNSKKSVFTRFGNYLKKNTGLSQFGPFRKISQAARMASDITQGTVNDIDNLLFKVIFGFDNDDGPSFYHQFTAEMRGIFTGFKDSVKSAFVGEDNTENSDGKKKGMVQGAIASISKGFGDLGELIFGKKLTNEESDNKKTIQEIGKELRDKMPKGMAGAVTGAGLSAFGGSLGLLPSMFLPGGPFGAAILGAAVGFGSQSEKMKDFIFGKKDENNERAGGLISKSFMDTVSKNKRSLIVGASAGALKSAIMGNGVIVGSLLGSGPIGGAIAGMGLGLLTSTEKVKSLLFGEMLEDGSRDKATGLFGKVTTSMSNQINKITGDKKGHKFDFGKIGAGVISGATGSAILGQMGILGSMLTLGGSPVLGALAGAATGITLSSEKWTKAIFGEVGDDGKRRGGKVGQIKNWLQINMGEPLKNKIEEYKIESSHWFDTKFADPLRRAIDPLTTALGSAVTETKNFITHGISSIFTRIFSGETGLVGRTLKGMGRGALGAADLGIRTAGSFLGGALSLPFRGAEGLANMYNNHVANKNYKRGLKDQYKNGDIGFFSYIGQKYNRNSRRQYFEDTMGYSPDYLKNWSSNPKHNEEYNARMSRLNEAKRQNELKKRMASQLGYKTVDAAGKDIAWIYDKDVKFEEDENGKIKAIRNTIQTATEQKSQAVQMGIADDVTSIREKMDNIIDALTNNTTEVVKATSKSASDIIANDNAEDKADDIMTYELAGYDPKTKKKLGNRKDINWLLANRQSDSTGETGTDKEPVGKEVEGGLSKLVNGAFGAISNIFGSGGQLLLGLGTLLLPSLLDKLGLSGDGTDAQGNTIENRSMNNATSNAQRNFFWEPIAKFVYKSTGLKTTAKEGIQGFLKGSAYKIAGLDQNLAKKGTKEIIESATKEAAQASVKEGAQKVVREGAEEGVKAVVAETAESLSRNKVKYYFEKAIKSVTKFFSDSKCVKQIGETVAGKFAKEFIEKLRGCMAKILTNDTFVSKFLAKVGACVGNTVAAVLSAGLIDIAFAGWDFFTGGSKAETADLFKVPMEDVNTRMRLVSGCMKALLGYEWIVLLDLSLEFITSLTGSDLKQWGATRLYDMMADEEDQAALKISQQVFEQSWKEYNNKNGTDLTKSQYSDEVNQNLLSKVTKASKQYFSGSKTSISAAQSYQNSSISSGVNSYTNATSKKTTTASNNTTSKLPTSNAMNATRTNSTTKSSSNYKQSTSNAMNAGFGKGQLPAGKGVEPDVVNDFAYYAQTDDRFANVEYLPSGGGRFSDPYIRQRACGPTSAAMVVKQLTGDSSVTPVTMTQFSTANGCSVDAGTTWDFFGKVANKYGLQMNTVTPNASNLSAITKKTPMIISGTGGPFYGGHFVVGVKGSNGSVTINDPIGSSASKTYSIGSILPYMRQGFSFTGGNGDYSAGRTSTSGSNDDSGSATTNDSSTSNDALTFLDYLNKSVVALTNSVFSGKPIDFSFADASSSDSSGDISSGSSTSASSSGAIEDGIVLSGDKNGLFHISAKYESGGYDPAAIGNDSTGGYSYGLFQFATNGGAPGFVNYLRSSYPSLYEKLGGNVGTATFNSNWKALATGSDAKKFQEAQEKYAYSTYYRGLVDQLPQIGFNNRKMAAKQIAFSTGIHLGTYQGKTAYNDIYKNGMSDSQLIQAIQDEKKLYFSKSTPAERAAVQNRLENEKNYALQLLKEQGGKGKSASGVSLAKPNPNMYKPLRVSPRQIQQNPALLKKFASKGAATGFKTAVTSSSLSNYTGDSYSKYIRNSSINTDSLRMSDMVYTVIQLLSNIDGNTALTASNISNLKETTGSNVGIDTGSLTANLFNNSGSGNSNSANVRNQNYANDRSSMMEKMRLIASGGVN